MTIDKRFVHYLTRAAFNTARDKKEIDDNSIVFIQDSREVYTHGTFYSGKKFKGVTAGDTTVLAAGVDDIITFLAGDGLEISVDTENPDTYGNITYSHSKTSGIQNLPREAGKYIDSVTFDQFGHVISMGVTERKVVITDSSTSTLDATGTLGNESVRINIVDGEDVTGSIGVKGESGIGVTYDGEGNILIGHSGLSGSQEAVSTSGVIPSGSDTVSVVSNVLVDSHYHVVSLGKIDLPTKSYVDRMISNGGGGSGMTLVGVLGTGTGMTPTLPDSASVGDTWRVGTSGTYGDITASIGDMIICTSANPLTWTLLPNTQEIASANNAGVVKGGFTTDINSRNFAVQILEDGTMFVNVPYQDALSSKNIISDSSTGTTEVTGKIKNGNVRLSHIENGKVVSSHLIKGINGATVTSENGIISIDSSKYDFELQETAEKKVLTVTGGNDYNKIFTFDDWYEGN